MTAVRQVTLTCDQAECENTITIPVRAAGRVQRTVRQQAQLAGWTKYHDEDFCPTHPPTRAATRYAECPRDGCGRVVQALEDGSLRRHRIRELGGRLGKTCRDPGTSEVHTRYLPPLTNQGKNRG